VRFLRAGTTAFNIYIEKKQNIYFETNTG